MKYFSFSPCFGHPAFFISPYYPPQRILKVFQGSKKNTVYEKKKKKIKIA